MSVDTLTVVPQNVGGIPFFSRLTSVGSCSPTTTTALGTTPLVNLVYDYYGVTLIRFDGYFDNSSITSFDLTPSGGSTLTFNVNAYGYYSSDDETQFGSSDDSRNLVAGTTYTIRLYSGSTSIAVESINLERREPVIFTDFYGATRNVPAIEPSPNEAFKLSWMKNAVKHQFSSAMSIAYAPANPAAYQFVSYTGYSTLLSIGNLGSMTDTSVDSIINFYNGATVKQFMSSHAPNTQSHIFTFNMTHTATATNSQWYKVSFTPSGGSEIAFYREDLTYTQSGTSHTWSKTYGTDPFGGAASGTFKLTC